MGRCKTSPSMPLVMNVEMEGGFIPPFDDFLKKAKKYRPAEAGRLVDCCYLAGSTLIDGVRPRKEVDPNG